jgi:hypothetical protein
MSDGRTDRKRIEADEWVDCYICHDAFLRRRRWCPARSLSLLRRGNMRYTHVGIREKHAALSRLPALPPESDANTLKATGTENSVSLLFPSEQGKQGYEESPRVHLTAVGRCRGNPAKHGKNAVFQGKSARVADGSRTRDNQIHNLVL